MPNRPRRYRESVAIIFLFNPLRIAAPECVQEIASQTDEQTVLVPVLLYPRLDPAGQHERLALDLCDALRVERILVPS
jgi:hypothetical protein